MNKTVISIKFCGGCKSSIDRGQIAEHIRSALALRGYTVVYNSPAAELVILISGCRTGCAAKGSLDSQACIEIAGTAVDAMEAGERNLPSVVMAKIDVWEQQRKNNQRE